MARTRTSFDDGWSIHVGNDIAHSRRILAKAATANGWSDLTTEEHAEAGGEKTIVEKFGETFQVVKLRPSSSDSQWRAVDLPHDWRLGQKPARDHSLPPDYPRSWQGFFPVGVAYYRKTFQYDPPPAGRRVSITFDGIAGFSDIWFNGFWVGQQCTHYSPVSIDLTEFLRPRLEGPNVILVRSDSREAEGWWYEGGGIYRHVWLETHGEVHVVRDGVHIRTTMANEEKASVSIQVEMLNEGSNSLKLHLEASVREGDSTHVVSTVSSGSTVLASCQAQTLSLEADINNPKLWELGNGRMYSMTINVVCDDGTVRDSVSCPFGIRDVEFVDDGIMVNGKWTKIYGANIHQDWAVYGVALPDRVIEAKLELCAEIGVNAIRCAHHPPTPELVDHADRMGMLLVPENRLLSASSFSIDQLRGMVRRFRNRPSVLLWSLENEEMDVQGSPMGRAILARLIKEVNALDPDRHTIIGGVVNFDDDYHRLPTVVGMHYRVFFGVLDEYLLHIPDKPHVLDEEGLYASTRGVYDYNKERAYAGSFSTLRDVMMDTEKPAANAALMPPNFKITGNVAANLTLAYNHPKVSGTFVWTALDYIGEPTPQRWPATTSSYGGRDLCGIPKDYYWLLRSLFRPAEPIVHVFPHWTWPGKEGERIQCRAYTNCNSVEFVVNGTVVASQESSGSLVVLKDGIEYQPGEFVARGYRGSEPVAEHRQWTAQQPSQLKMIPDRSLLSVKDRDVSFIRVAVTDNNGILIPDAAIQIQFSVSGVGRLVGAHNADPSTDSYTSTTSARAFNGFVGVYIATENKPGEIRVSATADGLHAASVKLTVSENENSHRVHHALDEAKIKLFGLHLSGEDLRRMRSPMVECIDRHEI
ncbi:hypothetical protein H2198_007212 [Neophaeococcomyces mojaviensis]|uniref:Uncharacterized protein n=1 Tax=Neophaeococcomyces mojaviensis TaxID=3383035 RepID=A0ACC3A138_9EURO|nr:hypothetical protein H2198_007212 [Knufia sp. JES_112]